MALKIWPSYNGLGDSHRCSAVDCGDRSRSCALSRKLFVLILNTVV